MEKYTRIGMYRVLRKFGLKRDEIYPEASFQTDLFFDENDWQCFLFFIENKFKISIDDKEIKNFTNLESSISVVNAHLARN